AGERGGGHELVEGGVVRAGAATLGGMAKHVERPRRALRQTNVFLDASDANLLGSESGSHQIGDLRAHLAACVETSEEITPRQPMSEYWFERVETALDLLGTPEGEVIRRYRNDH